MSGEGCELVAVILMVNELVICMLVVSKENWMLKPFLSNADIEGIPSPPTSPIDNDKNTFLYKKGTSFST